MYILMNAAGTKFQPVKALLLIYCEFLSLMIYIEIDIILRFRLNEY
jgi:hypothetical protein